MLSRVPFKLKSAVTIFASMIVWPTGLAGAVLIWEHDYGYAAAILGVDALLILVLQSWKQYLPRPIEPSKDSGGSFLTIMIWIVAGSFALAGAVSFALHDLNNALIELGIAAAIFLFIWLRRKKSVANQA